MQSIEFKINDWVKLKSDTIYSRQSSSIGKIVKNYRYADTWWVVRFPELEDNYPEHALEHCKEMVIMKLLAKVDEIK